MKLSRFFKQLKLQDNVEFMGEKFFVSTVKLSSPIFSLSFSERELFKGREIWYKTMVFKYDEDGCIDGETDYTIQYETKKEAIKGHYEMLKAMKNNYKTNRQYWRAKHGRSK